MINVEAPVFYYSIKNKWDKKKFLNVFVKLAAGVILAFLFAILFHITQLFFYTGDIAEALNIQINNIGYRTGLGYDLSNTIDIIRDSLLASKINIILIYLMENDVLFGFPVVLWIVIWGLSSPFLLISREFSKTICNNRIKLFALFIFNLVLFLGPLSWFVLASGHAYIHTHIDYLLWSTPFLIFIVIQVAIVFHYLFIDLYYRYKRYVILFILLFAGIGMYFYIDNCYYGDSLAKEAREGKYSKIFDDSSFTEIYFYNNKLIYITNRRYDETIFLHIYQENNDNFINCDFNIDDKEIPTYFWDGIIIAEVDIPIDKKINKIITGLWNGEYNLYETEIDFKDVISIPDKINVYNLSDERWDNGYKVDENCLLLYPQKYEYQLLKGKYLVMPNGDKNRISDIKILGDYNHLYFEDTIYDHNINSFNISD